MELLRNMAILPYVFLLALYLLYLPIRTYELYSHQLRNQLWFSYTIGTLRSFSKRAKEICLQNTIFAESFEKYQKDISLNFI